MRPTDRQNWKIISITGHRKVSKRDEERIWAAMGVLVRNPTIDAIYFGGALGADTISLRAAAFSRSGKKPHLTVVLPNKKEDQPYEAAKHFYLADEVIELNNPITHENRYESYKIRNKYLVDNASVLVGFFSGRWASGTGHAIRYAQSLGVDFREIRVDP